MALDRLEKERMDKLDFSKGGGFSDFITGRQKLSPADSKFLFIGLGGKGGSTVASLKTGVYQKILCDEKKKRPENFEYLVIDTDVNDLEKWKKGSFGEVGLSEEYAEICQLYDDTAAKKLEPGKRGMIPQNITQWLNPAMNKQLTGDGAGGVRQAGRYLLFGDQAFSVVRNALTKKLGDLHAQITDPTRQKLIVYIFAGIGGGTGSGTVIDIPYIIRHICKRNNWGVKVYSYLFLPDTYQEEARKQEHTKYNSYAALKEIDTLMNIGLMDGAAHFKAKYAPDFAVDFAERIFDSCILISGKKRTGLVMHPDTFSRNVVVDNIINLVTKSTTTNDDPLVNSFLDNDVTMIHNHVVALPEETTPKNAYYQYTVIGTGSLVLPIEEVLAYIAYHVSEKLEAAWDKHAQSTDVHALLEKVKIKPDLVADAILAKSSVSLIKDVKQLGANIKKEQVVDDTFSDMLKQYWMEKNVRLYDEWSRVKNLYIASITGIMEKECNAIFQDEDKGLHYLRELLSSSIVDGQTFNGVRMVVSKDYGETLTGLINGQYELQSEIRRQKKAIQDELGAMRIRSGSKLVGEYKKLCAAELVSENMIYLYEAIVSDCLEQMCGFLDVKIEELQAYVDVFDYLREIIRRNYEIAMDGTMPKAEYAVRLIDFNQKNNDLPTQRVVQYLDGLLEKAKPEGLAVTLEGDLLKTKQKWMHGKKGFNENFDPMSVFVNFLEQKFGAIPNLTIEKFIQLKYGADGFADGMRDICTNLMNKAEVIFPASEEKIALSALASKRYVVVPAGATDIVNYISTFANQQADKPSVARSADMNSIFWYNLVIGVPLFLLQDIQAYEDSYEANIISGMHCIESDQEKWKEWPALSSQMLWETADANRREKEYVKTVREDTAAYLACGLIHPAGYINEDIRYCAWCMPEGNSDITEESIKEWCRHTYLEDPAIDEQGAVDTGAGFLQEMAKANGFVEYIVNIPIVYMRVTEDSLYKIVRMNVFLYRKLRRTYELYKACKALLDEAAAGMLKEAARKSSMQRYYDYVRTGIIQATDDYVLLERKDGMQEEILDVEDYSVLQNEFYIYYALHKFMGLYDGEQLEQLDAYKTELLKDKSARDTYIKRSDAFIAECEAAKKKLQQLSVRKQLAKAGEQQLADEGAEFFDTFINMRKGRAKS